MDEPGERRIGLVGRGTGDRACRVRLVGRRAWTGGFNVRRQIVPLSLRPLWLCLLARVFASVAFSSVAMMSSGVGMPPPAGVTALKECVNSLLGKLDANEIGLVQAADLIEDELVKGGYGHTMIIAPRQVGLDPANRDGEGGNAQQVLQLAGDIFDVGFSFEATRHATCVEIIPGDDAVEDFNRRFSDGNGMPDVPRNSIQFGSLSGGHTNYVLRCIAARVATSREDMADKGVFCLETIRKKDPIYAQAVEQGLRWKVLRWEVRREWPRALQVIQAARNVPAQIYRGASEMQGMSQLHSLAATAMRAGEQPDWPSIKKAVLRGKPAWSSYVDELILFVASKSGGPDGPFLEGMKRFYRQVVDTSTRKSLPGGLYGALADMPHTYLAIAIWATAYTCPKDYVKAGLCSWLTVAEVKGLMYGSGGTCKARCQEAEDCLRAARGRLAKAGVPDLQSNGLTKVLTKLDVAVGRFVLNKQETSKTKFESIAAAGRQFLKDLAAEITSVDTSVYADLWPIAEAKGPEKVQATAVAADANAIGLVTLDCSTGEVTEARGRLRAAGFDVGSIVARRSQASTIFKVTVIAGDITTGKVTLEKLPVVTDLPPERVEVTDFLKNFGPADAKDVIEHHPGWPSARCGHVPQGKILRAKGHILAALGALGELLDEGARVSNLPLARVLEVHTKPMRRVVATCPLTPACVHMLPETHSVKALTDEEFENVDLEQSRMLEVTLDPPLENRRFFLASALGNDAMEAAWCVRTSPDEKEATCRWTYVDVGFVIGADFQEKAFEPVLKKRRIVAKAPSRAGVDFEEAVVEVTVTVPVVTNFRSLVAGAELVLFKAKAEHRAKEPSAITFASLSHKIRADRATRLAKATSLDPAAKATF